MAISRIFEQARTTPDKTAVVYNGVSCDYARFARWIEGTRRYLAEQELASDAVGVVATRTPLDAWVLGLALRSVGITTVVPGNAKDIETAGLRNIGCVVTTADGHPLAAAEFAAARGWRAIRVPADIELGAASGALLRNSQTQPRPGGHILMTSGTTGVYKMVMRDPVAEAHALPAAADLYGISDRSVVYVANFGLWTAGGYRWPLTTWGAGGTVVIHPPPDLRRPLARHDMTHVFATPNTLLALLPSPRDPPRRNDAMRLLVTGGALPQALLAAATELLTRRVYSVLASTEASVLAITPIERSNDLDWHRIHPSREVQVVDEAGNVLGPGREGMVRARILDGIAGYLGDEAASREFFHDGYFYPGDVGVFGADGRLSLRGRVTDVVSILGIKVATGAIERALQDRLGVDGVCVIGIPGATSGEEIHLVVESRRRIERAEIEAAANAELGIIGSVPVRIDFTAKLPRNEMGKIRRLALKELLLLARDAKPGQRN